MNARLCFATLLLAAPLAAQQDDPMETHLYNVEFLTYGVQDFPGVDFSLSQDAIGTAMSASEVSSGRLSPDDLARLIKTNVVEDSWEHVQAAVSYQRGVLTVTNRRSVHEKIVQYLNYWRSFFGKIVVLDAAVVSVDPQLLARIRSAGNPERPCVLPPEHLRQLLDAAREGKNAELVKTMRVTAHPGQRVNLGERNSREFLRDYDVQIATAAVALDPIVDVVSTGINLDVRPFVEPFAGAVTLEVRAGMADLDALTDRTLRLPRDITPASPVPDGQGGVGGAPRAGAARGPVEEHKLQLPRISLDRLRTMLTVRSKESAIVASTLRKGRVLAFILTPTVVAADEKPFPEPAFEEQRLLRLYDISPLTRGVQDFPGPRLTLVSPSAGGAGPLTGATFALDEPAVMMRSEDVAALIRGRIAPETWSNRRNSIDETQRETLIIRQKPEVLREIDRVLGALLSSRAQMITTETVIVGFRKGARADWEAQVPALAPGGTFVESEKFDKLLEEAHKGQRVRLVQTGEITCFPQQRVHVFSGQQEAHLSDYEPQVSSFSGMLDPIIGIFNTGFVLDVRPFYLHGNEQISVEFRGQTASGQVKDTEGSVSGAGPLQNAQARILRWDSNVICPKGKWSLVALETVGRGDDAEDVAVFLRARQNVLK
jgi:hypothetical protein